MILIQITHFNFERSVILKYKEFFSYVNEKRILKIQHIIHLIDNMQQQVKLIVAEQLDKQKIEFLIFNNQVVGEGGFGVVKKAIRNDKPNQLLVAKIIPYQDDKKRQKIQKQIGVLRKLPPHPNLVRVEPLKCYSNNNYYIFMQYCPDGTLEDLRKKKKNMFTQDQIFDIFYQLMNGYKVLWNAKILHQDLKLQNVLISDNKYKLADFGFSIFYQGVLHGTIREGTLPYMPIQKLTQKQYYATTKSDVYAMGIMFFKLITGHHPYVQSKNKQYKAYLKQLKVNQLYLRPNFSSRFSIKFQHFFDLILKMVAKHESARIDFNVVYEYIQNEQAFQQIRRRAHAEGKVQKAEYQKLVIAGESEAIYIPFDIPQQDENKYKQQIEKKQKNKQTQQQQKTIKDLQKYIVSHRIIVYYFDRLTRRIYIQKLKKLKKGYGNECVIIEKIILGLLLFCRKITQNLLKQCKNGGVFPINHWKSYRKSNSYLIKMIERDQNYLQDLVIDCLSQSSQTKIKQKKDLLDKSKQDFAIFKELIKSELQKLYETKASIIKPDDRQNLITICYIRSGIEILSDFGKWQRDAIQLQNYFRAVQTEDSQVLFSRVTGTFIDKQIDFTIDLGPDQV